MTAGRGQQGLNWSISFEAFPSPTRLKLAEPARAKVKGLTLFWGWFLKPAAAKKHLPSRLWGLRASIPCSRSLATRNKSAAGLCLGSMASPVCPYGPASPSLLP